jgi:hypothetical protein
VAFDPVTASLDLGAAGLNLIAVLQAEANSPDAQKAAQAKVRLAQIDDLARAQAANDIETERKHLERRMAEITAGK